MKTVQSPRSGAFSLPASNGQTIFDYLYTVVLGGPLWASRPSDVTSARAALDELHGAPLTEVEIGDDQHVLLVELIRSATDHARYGSLAIAIMEAV